MAEIQVFNVEEHDKRYDAIATTDDVFPNMVDDVEIIIRSGDQAGKVTYKGEAALARSVFPVVMAQLDEEVLKKATELQRHSVEWSDLENVQLIEA